jgi:hypothetical protein
VKPINAKSAGESLPRSNSLTGRRNRPQRSRCARWEQWLFYFQKRNSNGQERAITQTIVTPTDAAG